MQYFVCLLWKAPFKNFKQAENSESKWKNRNNSLEKMKTIPEKRIIRKQIKRLKIEKLYIDFRIVVC